MKKIFLSIKVKKISVISFLYWLITLFMERFCLDLSGLPNRLITYIVVRIILYFFIFAIVYFIAGLPQNKAFRSIVFFSLPYIIFTFIKWLSEDIYPFVGDDAYIYDAVVHFTTPEQVECTFNHINGMFTYFTSYFYLISMMLLPPLKGIAVVIVKIVLSGLSVGYCVHRINNYYHTFCGILIYGIFFFRPSSELGVCVQRMPMYGMLYLYFVSKLFFDYKECIPFSKRNFSLLSIVISVLTQWRVEGIYLFVIGPILVWIAYNLKSFIPKSRFKHLMLCYLLIQLVLYIPQGYETIFNTDNYANHRITPFYNYVLTNMMRYGLEDVADSDDLAEIDRYTSIETIKLLNAEMGDEAFKDEYIDARSDADLDDLNAYESAMKRIIFHNPLLYLEVQLRAFKCITTQYGVSHIGSACTTLLFGNVILSILVILICWICAMIIKDYFIWWLSSGLLCHTVITTLLLPAAYFKYYYAQYICAGFFTIIIFIVWRKNCRKKLV